MLKDFLGIKDINGLNLNFILKTNKASTKYKRCQGLAVFLQKIELFCSVVEIRSDKVITEETQF